MAQAEPKQLEEEVMVPHLKLKASMISPLVLVVGDPARAKFASTLLEVCIIIRVEFLIS
jgi:uridine phosphorylase